MVTVTAGELRREFAGGLGEYRALLAAAVAGGEGAPTAEELRLAAFNAGRSGAELVADLELFERRKRASDDLTAGDRYHEASQRLRARVAAAEARKAEIKAEIEAETKAKLDAALAPVEAELREIEAERSRLYVPRPRPELEKLLRDTADLKLTLDSVPIPREPIPEFVQRDREKWAEKVVGMVDFAEKQKAAPGVGPQYKHDVDTSLAQRLVPYRVTSGEGIVEARRVYADYLRRKASHDDKVRQIRERNTAATRAAVDVALASGKFAGPLDWRAGRLA